MLIAFFAQFSLSSDAFQEGSDAGIQVLMKLGLYFTAGMLALFGLSRNLKIKIDRNAASLMLVLLWSIIPGIFGPSPAVAFATTVSMIGIYVFIIYATQLFGFNHIFESIYIGLVLMIVVSFATYLAAPATVMMQLWNGEYRYKGFMGHPNSMGQVSVFTILISLTYFYPRVNKALSKAAVICITIVSTLGLILTDSKTSMVLCIITLSIVPSLRLLKSKSSYASKLLTVFILISLYSSAIVLTLYKLADETTLASFSRSGNAQEVTTLTGRTEVWQTAISLIAENPLIGYGLRAGQVLLPEVWKGSAIWVPPHSHNMYLEALLATGLVGLLFLIYSIIGKFVGLVSNLRRKADLSLVMIVLLVFISCLGVFELSGFGTITVAYVFLCCVMSYSGEIDKESGS
ncbi:O-antigen ligase family protein [Deinococcus sp. RM]|uniref:O-antigen ligase family protein n=1 Tax=Deinococcus sp. RM TaxID=2316359 RepID=UPI001314454E|nr:O-antigen ligase family protein [Deinococcus sp. RM]